jgi:uncharacterized membrane protein YbjE (DUF340 family)
MLFVGLLLPLPIGTWLIRRRADLFLSLVGLASVPVIVWSASLGAKIGPCDVPSCMSHTQHSHLVLAIVALVILLGSFVALAMHQRTIGGSLLVVAELVSAYSMLKTDAAAVVMHVIFGLSAAGYLLGNYLADRDAKRVPDFPPVS